MKKVKKYSHLEELHNTHDPKILVPLFYNIVKPESVVDVGCGLGTFLNVFEQEFKVKNILGIDGKWVDKHLLSRYISVDKFRESDLETKIFLNEKYDLALCLEVAEHLDEKSSDIFIESLTRMSDVIIFSAAIPYQLGDHHLNLQWPEYWQKKFVFFGFKFYDCIRPEIWDNEEIYWWYRQNIFLVIKDGNPLCAKYEPCKNIQRVVHPSHLKERVQQLLKIKSGGRGPLFYFILMLKSLKRKVI